MRLYQNSMMVKREVPQMVALLVLLPVVEVALALV